MNNEFENYKKAFLKKNFYNIEEISEEEYKMAPTEENEFYYNKFENNELKYYKRIPIELNGENFLEFIQIKQYEINESNNKILKSIKNMFLFIVIIIIIKLIWYFFVLVH